MSVKQILWKVKIQNKCRELLIWKSLSPPPNTREITFDRVPSLFYTGSRRGLNRSLSFKFFKIIIKIIKIGFFNEQNLNWKIRLGQDFSENILSMLSNKQKYAYLQPSGHSPAQCALGWPWLSNELGPDDTLRFLHK